MNIPYVFKKCTKCGEILPATTEYFNKKKSGKYGLRADCKNCRKQYHREYYKDNKDDILEYHREYYKDNKDYILEESKKYYVSNKDTVLEKKKDYYDDNKDAILEKKKDYYDNNKDTILKKQKEYYQTPQGKIVKFNRDSKRRSKLENQGKGITKEQWLEMMRAFDWKCAYSGEEMTNNNKANSRTIDHIIALENGGVNEIWNLIPMKKGYNSSKKDRIDTLNWYKEQEYFSEERLAKIVKWQIYAYIKWATEEDKSLILITNQMEVI